MPPADPPLNHIARPNLPWRDDELTECGKPAADIAGEVLTRDEAHTLVRQLGKTRFSFVTCVTCWQTAEWNHGWEVSPTQVIAREAKRASQWTRGTGTNERLDHELRALAALVDAHREEFASYLTGLDETTDLAAARLARARRAARRR